MPRNSKGIEVAEIISDRCIGCQICTAECPVGAIEMAEGVAVIDPEACIGCGKCSDVCPVEAVRFEKKRRTKKAPEVRATARDVLGEYQGVAVFIEVADGQGAQVSWELVEKATELALTYGRALATLCAEVKPEIFLMGATPLGRDLASVVATQLQTGLTADCTGLDVDEETGLLLMTRPTFGGNIMATIFCEHHRPQMSTVRPRVMRFGEKDPDRKGNVRMLPWEPPTEELPQIIEFIPEVPALGSLDIAQAPALVVAGKGTCDPDAMPLLQELADLVGGVVACSRPVVEAGLMPYERQVGQTGKTVAPKLYIGVGVAGAVQHLVGMQGSEKIVAINADPEAPIFRVADVGLVGDYTQVVPALIAGLKKRMHANQ